MRVKQENHSEAANSEAIHVFNYINGSYCSSSNGNYIRGDFRERSIAIPDTQFSDVSKASKAATESLQLWHRVPHEQRIFILKALGVEIQNELPVTIRSNFQSNNKPQRYRSTLQGALQLFGEPLEEGYLTTTSPRELISLREAKPAVIKHLIPASSNPENILRRVLPHVNCGNTQIIGLLHNPSERCNTESYHLLLTLAEKLTSGVINVLNGTAMHLGCALMKNKQSISRQLIPYDIKQQNNPRNQTNTLLH